MWADADKLTNPAKGQHGLGVDGTDIWNVAPYVWTDGGSFTNTSLTTATGYMNGDRHRGCRHAARQPGQGRGHRLGLCRRLRSE